MKIGCGCIVAEVRLGASRWQQRRHIMTCRILYSVLPSTQPPGEYTANVKRAYASSSSSLSLRISLLATNNKLCATVHRCLQHKAPQYMIDCCVYTSDIARRQHLRSAGCRQLLVPRHRRSMFRRRAWQPGTRYQTTFEIRRVLLTVFVVT